MPLGPIAPVLASRSVLVGCMASEPRWASRAMLIFCLCLVGHAHELHWAKDLARGRETASKGCSQRGLAPWVPQNDEAREGFAGWNVGIAYSLKRFVLYIHHI